MDFTEALSTVRSREVSVLYCRGVFTNTLFKAVYTQC